MVFNATFNNISVISGDQFQWWKKSEYPERTTDHGQATGKMYHFINRVKRQDNIIQDKTQISNGQNKLHFDEMRPTSQVGFLYCQLTEQVYTLLYSDTLPWFLPIQSLLLHIDTVCLKERLFYSIWFDSIGALTNSR